MSGGLLSFAERIAFSFCIDILSSHFFSVIMLWPFLFPFHSFSVFFFFFPPLFSVDFFCLSVDWCVCPFHSLFHIFPVFFSLFYSLRCYAWVRACATDPTSDSNVVVVQFFIAFILVFIMEKMEEVDL